MSNPNGGAKADKPIPTVIPKDLTCGLIMPISAIDGASADHWAEVKGIIIEAVESIAAPRFVPSLVSDADEIGVIQKRIVQNVYNSTIVVCDVSAKNPNVMFELGLRLAFDKPTVIIKDDKTEYSFDTGVIEHVPYPRDLRFTKIVEFKKKLADKVANTYKASVDDSQHSPFLKSFGQFHIASLTQSEATPDKIMMEMLVEMQKDVQVLKRRTDTERAGRADTSYSFNEIASFVLPRLIDRAKRDGVLLKDISVRKDLCDDIAMFIRHGYGIHFSSEDIGTIAQRLINNHSELGIPGQ